MVFLFWFFAAWFVASIVVALVVGACIRFRDAVADMNDFPIGDDVEVGDRHVAREA